MFWFTALGMLASLLGVIVGAAISRPTKEKKSEVAASEPKPVVHWVECEFCNVRFESTDWKIVHEEIEHHIRFKHPEELGDRNGKGPEFPDRLPSRPSTRS